MSFPSILLSLCRPAFERNQSAWPELDEYDNKNDHVGLRCKGVRGVEVFNQFLKKNLHGRMMLFLTSGFPFSGFAMDTNILHMHWEEKLLQEPQESLDDLNLRRTRNARFSKAYRQCPSYG